LGSVGSFGYLERITPNRTPADVDVVVIFVFINNLGHLIIKVVQVGIFAGWGDPQAHDFKYGKNQNKQCYGKDVAIKTLKPIY